jgi:hypothetical protein
MIMNAMLKRSALLAAMLFSILATAGTVPITFVVDMQYQISHGNFKPAAGVVEIHGSWNGWVVGTGLTNSPSNTNVYSNTLNLSGSPGDPFEFKFVYNNNDGAGNHWELPISAGGTNRSWILAYSAETYPGVYFSDISSASGQAVTFKVDMHRQLLDGNFNPSIDQVQARGTFQMPSNWVGAEFVLTNSSANPTVYTGTYSISNVPPNTQFDYKFVTVSGGVINWENPTTEGGSPTRCQEPVDHATDTEWEHSHLSFPVRGGANVRRPI